MRHLFVAVLVIIVVNAQLTWWIIYALRENRTRLRLERAEMKSAAELWTGHVDQHLERAETIVRLDLLTRVVAGVDPGRWHPYFAEVDTVQVPECSEGWRLDGDRAVLRVALADSCYDARAVPAWQASLLTPPAGLEVLQEPSDTAPSEALPPPLEGFRVRPAEQRWQGALEAYQRRIVMVVSEGSFFAVLILVMLGLLWKTMRREVELERQHQNFLSAITHELKSPLASMRLSLETVLRGRADSTASLRFLENALQDTERLQSLVQKVLEVTRYARGHGSLEPRRMNLTALVDDAVRSFARRATAAGARLDADLEPDVWAEVDGEAFVIVVSNLLENAIKYGGTIPEIRVRLAEENGTAVLTVRDNGRGIPEEEVPFVFNRFFRGGDEMTRTTQGTGLGLYLVRQIIEAHRGSVDVASTGVAGTTLRVVVPEAEVMEGLA